MMEKSKIHTFKVPEFEYGKVFVFVLDSGVNADDEEWTRTKAYCWLTRNGKPHYKEGIGFSLTEALGELFHNCLEYQHDGTIQ